MSDVDRNKSHEQEGEVVDGEVVAEFPSETLMHLPTVPDEDEALSAAQVSPDDRVDVGRRQFVVRLLAGGVAALALGGGAAILYNNSRRREPTVLILPNGSELEMDEGAMDVAALIERISELEYELASVTAERDQLISDMSQANAELEDLRVRLEEAQTLNDLWQSLDSVGLDSLLNSALQVVAGALSGVSSVAALLQTGLETGQAALNSFVEALPGPQEGIRWLGGQVEALADALEWLAEQVQEAVEPVEPFTTMIAEFVLWVLDRLPFGAGARARAGMEAMQDVINRLPDLIAGINDDVLVPLADWFGENERRNLFGILLDPITEHVIDPATDILKEIANLEDAYQAQLSGPVQQALEQRAAIRSQIQEAQARMGWRA